MEPVKEFLCYTNSTVSEDSAPTNEVSESTQGVPPIQAPEPPRAAEAKPATEQQLQEVKEEMSGFERSTLLWSKVTCGVFAVTLLFIALQWIAVRGQLGVMSKQLDSMNDAGKQTDRIIAANERLAKAAEISNGQGKTALDTTIAENRKAVGATLAQAKTSMDASIKDSQRTLRPYVYVSGLSLIGTFAEGQRIVGQASLINGGRTPAVSAIVCADLALRERAFVFGDDFPCPAPGNPPELPGSLTSVTVIGPSNPPIMTRTRGTTITPSIPGTLIETITSGAIRLYFYGEVTYTDLLTPTTHRHTQFCGIYNIATGLFDACDHHNRVD